MDPDREAFQFGCISHFLRSDIMNSTCGHSQPSVNNPPQIGMSESNIKDFMQAARAVSGACLDLANCVDALAHRPVSRHLVLWVIHIYQRSAYAI
jgi:hypothetical protein